MSQALPENKSAAIPKAYDLEACRELMRGGSKSFFAASKLLPTRLPTGHRAVCVLPFGRRRYRPRPGP